MFGFVKKMFIGLLTSIVNAPNHTKGLSLNNQACMIQSTIINLRPNECIEGLHYNLFAVNFDG